VSAPLVEVHTRRLTRFAGARFSVNQQAIELALEALRTTDISFAFQEEERELDGESVSATEAWSIAALRALEIAAKGEGDVDFGADPLCVDRPTSSAVWRIAHLKVATLRTLASLCIDVWAESEFGDASIILALLFDPAITGAYDPLPEGTSPVVNGASIGVVRHAALTGGKLGARSESVEAMAEHLLACGVDPFVAEPLLDSWGAVHDDGSYQGRQGVHIKLLEIVRRQRSERVGDA
jgi:hypothetical protein